MEYWFAMMRVVVCRVGGRGRTWVRVATLCGEGVVIDN
jgi:hypothetical protein